MLGFDFVICTVYFVALTLVTVVDFVALTLLSVADFVASLLLVPVISYLGALLVV